MFIYLCINPHIYIIINKIMFASPFGAQGKEAECTVSPPLQVRFGRHCMLPNQSASIQLTYKKVWHKGELNVIGQHRRSA